MLTLSKMPLEEKNDELLFKAKKLKTKPTTKKKENLKNGKVGFCLNIDIIKEKEDSWLTAIKTKIVLVKTRINFNSKRAQQPSIFTLWNVFLITG